LNGDTYPGYRDRRCEIYYDLGKIYSEEKSLFHASPNAKEIGKTGFDISLARSSGLLGKG
jgi:hypothetical protein